MRHAEPCFCNTLTAGNCARQDERASGDGCRVAKIREKFHVWRVIVNVDEAIEPRRQAPIVVERMYARLSCASSVA